MGIVRAFLALLLCSPVSAGTIVTGQGSGSITTSRGGGSVARVLASASNPCVGNIETDPFTEEGVGNINLANSSAAAWTGANASDGSLVIDRSADELRNTDNTGATKIAHLNLTASCANYSVTASAKTGTIGSGHRVGVLGRFLNTSGGNGYRFRIEGDGTARLDRQVNGTGTDLDTATIASFSSTTYYTLKLEMVGTTIKGYVNGVEVCSATDSTHTSAGSPGVLLRNSSVRMTSVQADYP